MNSVDLHFTRQEFAERLAKTRDAMVAKEIEVLIVSDPSNMAWLTGYDGWSFYTHQAVIISLEGEPIWWGRGIDALGAKLTVYMDEANIIGYDDSYVQNPDKHPMETLATLLQQRSLATKAIGVELDNYYFSGAALLSLYKALNRSDLIDATALVNWQRAIKSTQEIDYMRRAARIVEKMHAVILEKAEPGLPKNQLVADIYHAAIMGADGHWGDYPAIVPMAPSGMDATAPHLTWDDKPMLEGEATFFEIAGVYRRYHCPQSRTLFLGKPPQKYRDAEEAVLAAVEAGLDQAKPGNFAEDIANAFNETLNRFGFIKDNRCGYAIGLSYPPDWGERTISFRRGDKTVLEPGMTFHFMPALWLDDGGLEITESIVISDKGYERFCTTEAKLFVKA